MASPFLIRQESLGKKCRKYVGSILSFDSCHLTRLTINALISTPTHVTERATSLLTHCNTIHKHARHFDTTATLGYLQPTSMGCKPADRPPSNLCPEITGVSNICNDQPHSNDNMKAMRTLSLVFLLLISLP